MLQCVAVCCSVLQCAAVCCSVLQCVAVCCSVLQCAAVCLSVLQCVAVCCSVLQCVAVCCSGSRRNPHDEPHLSCMGLFAHSVGLNYNSIRDLTRHQKVLKSSFVSEKRLDPRDSRRETIDYRL